MTKRKYKVFVDIVLVLLCLFPLLVALVGSWSGRTALSAIEYTEIIQKFTISTDLANRIGESINTFGIEFNGAFFPAVCTIMSNAMLVYIFYVFVAVLVWLPKFAINLLERSIGKD